MKDSMLNLNFNTVTNQLAKQSMQQLLEWKENIRMGN